jgi:hypothetical protein
MRIIRTAIYCMVIHWHSHSNLAVMNWTTRTGQWTLADLNHSRLGWKITLITNLHWIKTIHILAKFRELEALDLAEIRVFDGVGAEKFAEHAFNFADKLIREKTNNRCYVVSVECAEHGANSAIYTRD